jgi:hypothetical protein
MGYIFLPHPICLDAGPYLPMTNREDAIAWLIGQGLTAFKRDWSFGETVCVGVRSPQRLPDGEMILMDAVCIHPLNGEWAVTDLGGPSARKGPLLPSFQGALLGATEFSRALLQSRNAKSNARN